jgi:hypothetical protein
LIQFASHNAVPEASITASPEQTSLESKGKAIAVKFSSNLRAILRQGPGRIRRQGKQKEE